MSRYEEQLKEFMEALKTDYKPNDVLVFADWLDENNESGWADSIRDSDHSWQDVSYHGSPTYQCEFCGVYKSDAGNSKCPEAMKKLVRRFVAKYLAEKNEYENLVRKKERQAYLTSKYGG